MHGSLLQDQEGRRRLQEGRPNGCEGRDEGCGQEGEGERREGELQVLSHGHQGDLRADRQPEFTQLDVEMSFVEADDVMGIIDELVVKAAKVLKGLEVQLPLPRMTYDEAMERFGHDAPDLRFGMELIDCTDLAATAEFRVFKAVADSGGRVRGINAKGSADQYSRRLIDELTEYVQNDFGAKGLAWFKVDADGKLASPIPMGASSDSIISMSMDSGASSILNR